MSSFKKNLIHFFSLIYLLSCSQNSIQENREIAAANLRGQPWEYDPGAPKDSKWPDLFAETPNYRAFGEAIIGGKGEKFRWMMGPMWYRGRLAPRQVKVFVIGQEGAQDENVSNRSFTGSTGTRMQKFLNYLGIDRSYLFMNTFVYTITGQYSLFGEDAQNSTKVEEQKKLLWLAQDENSIVVKHRHKLFNYMLEQNKGTLSLVIGVGTAGKDTTATWFRSHGGTCNSSKVGTTYCEGKGELSGVIGIGVQHPGAASARNGGDDAMSSLIQNFAGRARIVADYASKNPGWLKVDPGMSRDISKPFRYGDAAIPHRDFAFGTNWRMGEEGTASNRRGPDGIQIYSSNGCYNNVEKVPNASGKLQCDRSSVPNTKKLFYDSTTSLLSSAPSELLPGDVPYESPKHVTLRRSYDEGPGFEYAQLLLNFYNQDYASLGITSHSSFGHTGIYRGRFEQAKVLVLADQESHDDMFSGRALTGAGGQYLQTFLDAIGLTESYVILRSLPVDSLDLNLSKQKEIALNSDVSLAREKIIQNILDKGQTQVIIAVGEISHAIVDSMKLSSPVIKMPTLTGANFASATTAFNKIKNLKLNLDKKMTKFENKLSIIPRIDLPAYTRFWMGTSGNRAVRAYEMKNGKKVYNGDYYIFEAPRWATKWIPGKLSPEELESLNYFNQNFKP
jgi:uracil-DNA glycosylase